MRSNLYSLQGTASLMATIQGRLSSGKKVNSAIDNPNNFFAAQSLTNRAADLSALLDGMGQAIQALKTTSNGITALGGIVDQLKSVATKAAQSITSASSADNKSVTAYTPLGTKAATVAASVNATVASTELLTDVTSSTSTVPLVAGDTITVTDATAGTSYTFTVGLTATTATGNGGGTTIADLTTWLKNNTGNTAVTAAAGVLTITNAGANAISIGGSGATKLGINASSIAAAGTQASSTLTINGAISNATAVTTGTDHTQNLTSLVGRDAKSLNILNGDKMTVQVGTGATYTFTVGAASTNNTSKGNGGGSTLDDLATWMNTITGTTVSYSAAGQFSQTAVAAGVTIAGNLASNLGLTASNATGALVSAAGLYTTNYTNQAAATGSTKLANLTDTNGKVLSQVGATTGGTTVGNYLTLQVGGGTTKSINITADTTVQDLLDSVNSISGLSASLDSVGTLKVVNNNSTSVTIGGTASGLIGNTSISANSSTTNLIYEGYGKVVAANLPTTSLTNLQPPTGQDRLATGDQLKLTIDGVTTAISIGAQGSTETATNVTTVKGLLNALGQIAGVTATLDSASGRLDIKSTNGKTISFDGTATAKLSLPSSVAPGQSTAGGSAVSAATLKEFDDLRVVYDKQVQDVNYKGINLVSSAGNNPLSVTFNEAAVNANKLVINAVDLTVKGLGISDATTKWKDTASIESSLAELTNAANTLRDTASRLGQNLTTVQTRQDFTNNMIATLKSGADDLTLADMNEESANMLALQTRQQLGIQSLSLASQANQAVMRLFG